MKIIIFANIIHTNTLAGGDKIFIECAKRWIQKKHDVTIVTNEVGKEYCVQSGIAYSDIVVWSASWADKGGVYFAMTMKALITVFHSVFSKPKQVDIVFASSFFFPDLFPALVIKQKQSNAQLVIGSYLFTYKKWGSDYSGGKVKGFLFYINQVLSLSAIKKYAGKILTASSYDKKFLIDSENIKGPLILSIRGGVDNAFFSSISQQSPKYDAVFVGRFHPQKCVSELIDIWFKVVEKIPSAKLALVGNGFLEHSLRLQTHKLGLQKNIFFLGSQEGIHKAYILKSSKVFVSTSRYDSGNIALDEALACGIPGIIYDLPYLNYQKGVIKIPVGNQSLFVEALLSVISNDMSRVQLGREALEFAKTIDWDNCGETILNFMSS